MGVSWLSKRLYIKELLVVKLYCIIALFLRISSNFFLKIILRNLIPPHLRPSPNTITPTKYWNIEPPHLTRKNFPRLPTKIYVKLLIHIYVAWLDNVDPNNYMDMQSQLDRHGGQKRIGTNWWVWFLMTFFLYY